MDRKESTCDIWRKAAHLATVASVDERVDRSGWHIGVQSDGPPWQGGCHREVADEGAKWGGVHPIPRVCLWPHTL